MSIKINNGYRIVGPTGTKELFDFCESAAKTIRLAQKEEILKLMALYLSMEFDLAAAARRGLVDDSARPLRINDEEGSVIHQVMGQVADRVSQASRSEVRDIEFDMSATLSIFRPHMKGEKEFFPVMLFATKHALVQAWDGLHEVRDFHYQTVEERPEAISPEEWEFRSLVWERVMPHGRPPIECSLSYHLSEATAPFGLRDQIGAIPEKIPDYDVRVRTLARLIASHEKSNEILGDRSADDFTMNERIRMSHDIARWLHENMDKVLEEKSPVIRSIIPERITLDRVLHPMKAAL